MTSVDSGNLFEFEKNYAQHCVKYWNEWIKVDAFEVANDEQKFSTNVNTSTDLMDNASWLNYFGLNPKCYISFHYGQIYAEWENIDFMLNDSAKLHDFFVTVRNIEVSTKKNFSNKERQGLFLWMYDSLSNNLSNEFLKTMLEKINQDPTPFKQISNADYVSFKNRNSTTILSLAIENAN